MTYEKAKQLALDWAEGRLSHTNIGHHHGHQAPYTPDVIAAMDAQEVVKWTAIAAMLLGEYNQHERLVVRLPS